MSKFKSNAIFKYLVVGLLAIYVFFALTNILFIPHNVSAISNAGLHPQVSVRRYSLQQNSNAVIFNMVTDKSILDDDLLNSSKAAAIIILFVFGGLQFLRIKSKKIPPDSPIFYNLRYSYLFFCRMRI